MKDTHIYHEIYLKAHPEIKEIPKGYVIHHKDFNHENNDPDNLEMMTIAEHTKIHHKNKTTSEETKRKQSEAKKGKKYSDETKALWSANRKGRKHTEEAKQKMSESRTGKKKAPHTEETKNKISNSNKGQIPWNKGIKTGKRTKEE